MGSIKIGERAEGRREFRKKKRGKEDDGGYKGWWSLRKEESGFFKDVLMVQWMAPDSRVYKQHKLALVGYKIINGRTLGVTKEWGMDLGGVRGEEWVWLWSKYCMHVWKNTNIFLYIL